MQTQTYIKQSTTHTQHTTQKNNAHTIQQHNASNTLQKRTQYNTHTTLKHTIQQTKSQYTTNTHNPPPRKAQHRQTKQTRQQNTTRLNTQLKRHTSNTKHKIFFNIYIKKKRKTYTIQHTQYKQRIPKQHNTNNTILKHTLWFKKQNTT